MKSEGKISQQQKFKKLATPKPKSKYKSPKTLQTSPMSQIDMKHGSNHNNYYKVFNKDNTRAPKKNVQLQNITRTSHQNQSNTASLCGSPLDIRFLKNRTMVSQNSSSRPSNREAYNRQIKQLCMTPNSTYSTHEGKQTTNRCQTTNQFTNR